MEGDVMGFEDDDRTTAGARDLDWYVVLGFAADSLPRSEWNKAQRTARPKIDDDCLKDKWTEWRKGGLMWLGGRTDPMERHAVFAAVLRQVENDSDA
jgi:hypothetical protein